MPSHISAADDAWSVVTKLHPYTKYQFQLIMHNESVLQSEWITTDMDGMSTITYFVCLLLIVVQFKHFLFLFA